MACFLEAPSHYLNQCWLINGFFDIHMRAISQDILMISICNISLKITFVKNYCGISHRPVSETLPTIAPDSKVHGAHLGPTGPRWAPCWPHELCYLGLDANKSTMGAGAWCLGNDVHFTDIHCISPFISRNDTFRNVPHCEDLFSWCCYLLGNKSLLQLNCCYTYGNKEIILATAKLLMREVEAIWSKINKLQNFRKPLSNTSLVNLPGTSGYLLTKPVIIIEISHSLL